MDNTLENLELTIKDKRPKLYGLLAPGVSATEVEGMLKRLNFNAIEDVAMFYSWHNGLAPSEGVKLDDIWLVPPYYFLSLDESIFHYENLLKKDDWNKDYFPFMTDGIDGYYAFDLSKSGETPIVWYLQDSEITVEANSVLDFFKRIVDAYKNNVIYMDSQGDLQMDDDAFDLLKK